MRKISIEEDRERIEKIAVLSAVFIMLFFVGGVTGIVLERWINTPVEPVWDCVEWDEDGQELIELQKEDPNATEIHHCYAAGYCVAINLTNTCVRWQREENNHIISKHDAIYFYNMSLGWKE